MISFQILVLLLLIHLHFGLSFKVSNPLNSVLKFFLIEFETSLMIVKNSTLKWINNKVTKEVHEFKIRLSHN